MWYIGVAATERNGSQKVMPAQAAALQRRRGVGGSSVFVVQQTAQIKGPRSVVIVRPEEPQAV